MSAILCDEAGSPVIDSQGNVLICQNNTCVLQAMHNALSTMKGSELFNLDHGIDFRYLNSLGSMGGKAMIIQSMISEAITPSKIKGLNDISNIIVNILDNVAYIEIHFNIDEIYGVSLDVN